MTIKYFNQLFFKIKIFKPSQLISHAKKLLQLQDNRERSIASGLIKYVIDDTPTKIRGKTEYLGYQDLDGNTATIIAAQNNSIQCLRELLALHLYNVQQKKKIPKQEFGIQNQITGKTALMYACENGSVEAAKLTLFDQGLRDKNGLTALSYSIMKNSHKLVNLLKPLEGNLKINGLTPLQFCIINDRFELFNDFEDQRMMFSEVIFSEKRLLPLMIAALAGKVQYLSIFNDQIDCACSGSISGETVFDLLKQHIQNLKEKQHESIFEYRASNQIIYYFNPCKDLATLQNILDVLTQMKLQNFNGSYPELFFNKKNANINEEVYNQTSGNIDYSVVHEVEDL